MFATNRTESVSPEPRPCSSRPCTVIARGKAGSMRLAPFLGINNVFNHLYVSSVVINAARDRFYEPAPGRNVYVGLSVGAGR